MLGHAPAEADMSRTRPLFALSPHLDAIGSLPPRRPWRLVLMLTGLLLWIVSGALPSPIEALPYVALIGRRIGGGLFILGLVWALARVIASEQRRRLQMSPLARTVDQVPWRRRHP